MKKIVSVFMALVLLLGAVCTGAAETGFAGMPNPMTEYASLEELTDEYPGLEMEEVPEGAEEVHYFVITAGSYAVADVQFKLDGIDYDYRAVQCVENDAAFYAAFGELAGLFYEFDVSTQETAEGRLLHIRYCTSEQVGAVEWFDDEADCAYSLSANAPLKALKETAAKLVKSNSSLAVAEGTVLAFENGQLKLRLLNGNVVTLACDTEEEIVPGDSVELTYAGDLLNAPYIVKLEVTEPAGLFSGTVTAHDNRSVTVKAANGSTLVFALTGNTVIAGADTAIKNHAQVTVTYSGSLTGTVSAFEVYIDVPGEEMDPSLIDKTLSGTVTKLTGSLLSIKTNKGKKYSFKITRDTEENGKYELKVNCTVTVRYDGYASNTPDAKEITVTKAAPKPTPKPTKEPTPKTKKVSGTITAVCGVWITLDDGHVYTVNSSYTKIKNADLCEIGNWADLTYYKDGSDRICTKATFSRQLDF